MEEQKRSLTPEEDALEHIVACRDKPFLEERHIDSFKGRGLFTHKTIEPSIFVVEYRGNIFCQKDTRPKRKCGDTLNNYLYEFSWEGANWCIDASKEDGTLGRLVNDNHISPNCVMKKIMCEGKPHLCLFAMKKISPGEEITYNYGDSQYPWRSRDSYGGSSSSNTDFYATFSTPRIEKPEDSAASSSEESCSDDDDTLADNGPSQESDSFEQENETASKSDEHSSDGDYEPDKDALSADECGSDEDYIPIEKNSKDPSFTSKNYCYVCGKGIGKISRHLLRHADEEPDIAEAFALPKNSKERKKLLENLRNRGNFKHNEEVLRNNSGVLKPMRRPRNMAMSAKTYAHCLYCKGMYKRKELWRHVARCTSRTMSNPAAPNNKRVLGEIAHAESPFSQKISPGVWKMFQTMEQDEIAFVVQNDYLLLELAQYLFEKYGNKKNKHDYMRQTLREMGRLLLALHEWSVFSFADAIKPRNFYKVAESIKDIAGFKVKKRSYDKPNLALKLVNSLKKICSLVLAGTDDNEQTMREAKTFMTLCAKEWTELVSQTALDSFSRRKVDSPSTIPFTLEVQAFYRCLEKTSASATKSLMRDEGPQVYNALCRVTLAQVFILNKGAAEVSKMTLKSFQEKNDTTQVLSKHFIRINILSRTRQKVAVLLTSELVSAITLFVRKRVTCGVHKDNPFLFAKPDHSASGHHKGGSCIRVLSSLCHAKNPDHLRSMHLHKHTARVFQILNLENDGLSHLAKMLGQDIRADRDYYRLPESAVELAKIAKLLLAMEKGSLERFKGISLDEIEIEDKLESDVEQDNPKKSNAREDNEESDFLPQQKDNVGRKGRQLTPEEDALEHIKACRDKPFLKEKYISPGKGRGVFTKVSIEPSAFVVEYRGNVFTRKETKRRKCTDTLNNYLFDFSWNGTNWCVDASTHDGTLGRLVNDDHISPNCELKKVACEGKPHLCLFALKKISRGEEITYNYGDSSYPWRLMVEDSSDSSSAISSSGDEYVPDDGRRSGNRLTRNDNQQSWNFKNNQYLGESDSPNLRSSVSQHSDDSSIQQEDEDEDDYSSDGYTSDGEPKDPSCTTKNYCYVCGKGIGKISRHLLRHADDEPDIAEAFALPKNSKERKRLLEKLRNRGNYKHNQEVLKTKRGQLKVSRRKLDVFSTVKKFVPCIYCKGMYSRRDMWQHIRRCPSKKTTTTGNTKILNLVASTFSTDPKEISSDVREILRNLKRDEIASIVKNDFYILQLAQCLCHMYERKAKRSDDVKKRLRQMGRLLLTLRKKSISSVEDAIKPENFGKVMEAVRELVGFNEETKSCARPSLLLKLGYSLKTIGEIKFARALKEDADKETIHEAETFMRLCTEEWKPAPPPKPIIKSTPTLSFTKEVQLLYQCMVKTAESAVKSLTMYESPPVYNALLRVTVAQVSILNRNVFEVSRVTLKSFVERDETEPHGYATVCRSQLEGVLCKRHVKVNVRSKTGKGLRHKKVTVKLTPELLSAITLLVNKRKVCGVHKGNPYLFARPVAICTSFYQGQMCISTFAARCGVKNPENLRSVFFRKHILRIFQILSLTNDELDQLARLLGRNIRTDAEYYLTPEAAVDIAKILELLSATENGSLERFKGKSLEEIEFADELQPDVEQDNSESSDAEDDHEDVESSPKASGSFSPNKKSCSGRSKESENGESELNNKKNDEVNMENDRSEDMPLKRAVKKPEETPSCSNEDATNISFSEDGDMNVDFDEEVDTHEDVRNEENGGGGDSKELATSPVLADVKVTTKRDKDIGDSKKKERSSNKHTTDIDLEEAMDIDTEKDVEKKDREKRGEQTDWLDVVSSSSSAALNSEKNNKLSAALTGLKEVRIIIHKLNIENLKALSVCNKQPVKNQPVQEDRNQCENSSRSTNVKNNEKPTHMTCFHCKKSMIKGQTAYQKKGFTDVFCSKNCLFEIFPIDKPGTKTCHHCHKVITQPLDLIMAVVDVKGTMKDFCSLTCLSSFKSNSVSSQAPPQLCSACNKSCTTTCELTLNEAVHKFCSDSCLEGFRRDNTPVCENCSSPCHGKPLMLRLDEDTKTICSEECLQQFKEEVKTMHQCTMCNASKPMSDMFDYKSSEGTVELFCTKTCVTSYKLRPAIIYKPQGNRDSPQLRKRKKGEQSKHGAPVTACKEDAKVCPDSAVKENNASEAAELDVHTMLTITDFCVLCCSCGKRLPRGQKIYRPKSSLEVFCSTVCLSERHPHIKVATKNCYNCCQVIKRPHNIILAPVDDSGTMKELCSDTCLASVKSKRSLAAPKPPPLVGPRSECRMCAKYCYCKFKVTLDGIIHRLCSDTCFVSYHRAKNLPVSICGICSSVCLDKQFLLKTDGGSKTICSEECLVKFKEKIKTPQLCPMCKTSHQLSDMVEDKNQEGRLDFFCSNRCMMVHKAQSLTVSEKSNPSTEVRDIKDVKPLLRKYECIKEEPIDEGYNRSPPPFVSAQDIKDEPNVAKDDLKVGSVFSLTADCGPVAPTLAHMDLPASCSNCKKVLMDGETVYQRKGHVDIFCATTCLVKFYQKKPAKRTCQFCLQVITQPQDFLQAQMEPEGTMRDFCSQTCLSSFNYKKIMSTKIAIVPVVPHSQCSMCGRYCISKHEVIQQDVIHRICSDSCFLHFCNLNNLSICEHCRSHCSAPLVLKTEDGNKKLCGIECLAQFKKKSQAQQPCAMCRTSKLISDMVENENNDMLELFCTSSCVMASKIQAISVSGKPLSCDNCGKTTVPACHLAMSDASVRNFCTLTCAMVFKETYKDMTVVTNLTGAPDQTQCDFLKPPEKLPCAQCRRIIKTTPKVIQKKCKMNFVCSLACSQEFKRVNNITGNCEYCKNERIIRDAKRVDGKDCYFCSDGCKMLFRHELEKEWGKHCRSCAYCNSITKAMVTARYDGKEEEFCSEDCSSNFKMLFCRVAKCDTCGHKGKLRQSLPLLGDIKHFCDLKCILHFCNKKVQMVKTGSSSPGSSGTAEASPVITNVISLAGALAGQTGATPSTKQHGSVPDIQTKVIGHASIQTAPKELKNKSMLCTPLVHNKGVSCTTQTVDTEAQTDNFVPKVIVLPVPVPVYVPLPMNMYSQCTPKPVGLPIPLPVPVFLPVTSDGIEPAGNAVKERTQPEPQVEEPDFRSKVETEQDERSEREDLQEAMEVSEKGKRPETRTLKDINVCSHDLDKEDLGSFGGWGDSFADVSPGSPIRTHTLAPPPALQMREGPQSSPSPAPPPHPPLLLLQQTQGQVHNKNKLQQLSKAAKAEASQRDFSAVASRKNHKLNSQCGIDAWKRWIRWRESQTDLDPISSQTVVLKEDVLHYSVTELSDGLRRFIREVKRPDGEPYTPDSLFYLCLSIQQYLFENDRMENIFSDRTYNKFSTEFTKILKNFKPSVASSGYVHSRVEEEFLWDCKQLGTYSPIILLNTMLFFCCKYFGFTTVEQHRQLSFSHIMRCTKTNPDNTKTTFLRFYPPISISEAETDTDGVPAKKRKTNENKENILEMMENTENPLRCPVQLYEFYLSKCSAAAKQHSGLFYLHPEQRCIPNNPLWFSSTPLDDGTMEAMLTRMLTVRELQGRGGTNQRSMYDTFMHGKLDSK